MGRQLELRLLIYEYIPTPATVETMHCCASYDRRLVCDCHIRNSSTATNILAVSWQIFEEAMPVLYRDVEVHVSPRKISEYAAQHVRKAEVFMGYYRVNIRGRTMRELRDRDERPLTATWHLLRDRYPRLQQVRIHYQTD